MARPKKMESARLVHLVEDFFANEAAGDPARLQYSQLERYAKKCGVDIQAYDLRRDDAVRQRIAQLREFSLGQTGSAAAVAYKSLDVEDFIRRCSDLSSLKRCLMEMDEYWKRVYESAVSLLGENKALKRERRVSEAKTDELAVELKALASQLQGLTLENKKLHQENCYLKKQLKTYLYPALADELLRQEHLPAKENTSVKTIAFSELIDGATPSPFSGIGVSDEKAVTRQEQLLAQMKAQVDSDDV